MLYLHIMAAERNQEGLSSRTRFTLVVVLVAAILPLVFFSGAFGAITINLSLFSNPDLERGLVGHWTFDGEHVKPPVGGFDVSNASFVDSFSVGAQETTPTGLAFNTDGTTMFVVGTNGTGVYEYTLATGFDVSTATFVDSFSVAAQEAFPTGVAFSTDGTKMFVVGSVGDSVHEYALATAFDVSTATFVDSFSVAAQELSPTGVTFNTDGTTMFVVGTNGDSVHEYTLATGFDVSTASFADSFSVAAQETFPSGLAFSTDGATMFVVGSSGDSVYEYTLATSFDVSTASFVDSVSVATQDTNPRGVAFSTDGTTMFVVGLVGDNVYEYQLGAPFSAEDRSASGNDGVGKGGVTPAVGRLGQAIRFDGIDDYIDVGAVSGGVRTIAFWLKAATTTADMKIIAIDGTDRIELDGSGNVVASGFPSATVHVDGSSASAHIADTGWHHVVITDTSGVNAADFDIGRVEGAGLFGGTLDDVRLYDRVLSADEIKRLHGLGATTRINRTLTANPELEDGLVGHWTFDGQHVTPSADDVSTASFVDGFSVAAQDTDPWGLTFNADGTKMFIVGAAGDGVYEYTLTTGFDISTASFVDSFSVAAQDTNPRELAFSGDGTTMIVVGSSGASVYQYTLTTGFDVSTASFVDSFSIAAQETFATGLAFNTDGTTMFVVGLSGDSVYQYTLSTGFDVSTASFVDSVSVAAQETFPTGLAFSSDGTTMFVVGLGGTSAYQYRLTTGFDVSTASFVDSVSVAAQEAYPTDLAFSADGITMLVVGRSGDSVHEYLLGTSLAVEDRSANGNNDAKKGGATPAIGRIGQGLKFDGDDKVEVPHSTDLNITDALTVAGWVRLNTIGGRGIVEKTISGLVNQQYLLFVESGRFKFRLRKDVTTTIAGDDTLETDRWYHVAGVWDGTTMRLYVDSIAQSGTASVAAPIDAGTGITLIGHLGSGVYPMDGLLDDVRIYNRALSADEIKRLHGSGATTWVNRTIATGPDRKDGLVGHWTFDGPDMNNGVEDRSGERNTGTLSGYSATTTRPGVLGQALAFDGVDDYVSIPHISTPDELTYSFWINTSSSDTQNPLLSMRTLVRVIGGNQIQYFPDIDTTVVTASGLSLLDEWHHIAVTHDSSNNYVIYLDGVSELSGTTVDIDSGVVAGLGSRFGGYNSPGFVDGSMDDVRIYNRALSADEIKRLHAPGS